MERLMRDCMIHKCIVHYSYKFTHPLVISTLAKSFTNVFVVAPCFLIQPEGIVSRMMDNYGARSSQHTVKGELPFQQAFFIWVSARWGNILPVQAWTVLILLNRVVKNPKHITAIPCSSEPNTFPTTSRANSLPFVTNYSRRSLIRTCWDRRVFG